jgi:hypothetical protein
MDFRERGIDSFGEPAKLTGNILIMSINIILRLSCHGCLGRQTGFAFPMPRRKGALASIGAKPEQR